jgi:Uncharacterized homolog of phage Mu protein gp47
MPGPTFSLDDLTKPVTRAEVEASIYQGLSIIGVNTTSWKPGGVVRTIIAVFSIVLSGFSTLQAKIARSGFLELSSGDWLTLVARYGYGVERIGATFATGQVTITNSGGGVYSGDADDLIFSNSSTGKTYRNTAPFTLGALGSSVLAIQATEQGAASTSAPGAIDTMTTPLIGVTCSNDLAVIGSDAELDPSLRARCSEKLGALSPFGPWDAYASAVRNATHTDGTSLGITRFRLVKDGSGNVYVYLATSSGAVTGTVGDLTTDLGIADEAIQQLAAPLAVTAHTLSATPVTIAPTYEAWMYNTSGSSPTQVQDAIETALESFMSSQPIGGNVIAPAAGKVFVDAIRAVIAATFPEIFHVAVTLPAADVTLAITEVPVLGTPVCLGIHQSAPPEGFGG